MDSRLPYAYAWVLLPIRHVRMAEGVIRHSRLRRENKLRSFNNFRQTARLCDCRITRLFVTFPQISRYFCLRSNRRSNPPLDHRPSGWTLRLSARAGQLARWVTPFDHCFCRTLRNWFGAPAQCQHQHDAQPGAQRGRCAIRRLGGLCFLIVHGFVFLSWGAAPVSSTLGRTHSLHCPYAKQRANRNRRSSSRRCGIVASRHGCPTHGQKHCCIRHRCAERRRYSPRQHSGQVLVKARLVLSDASPREDSGRPSRLLRAGALDRGR
jgi:hypothetical protein